MSVRLGDELDQLPAADVVGAVVGGHREVVEAAEAAAPAVAALVERAAERLAGGRGRVVYVGAGTSGQVAAMDACEWGPTFSVPEGFVVVLRAGASHPAGSREEAAAEDDDVAGAADARSLGLGGDDVVVGLSAGGATPYVLAAMEVAVAAGALTGAVTCREDSPLARLVECPVVVPVGEEVVLGSTRLKAGTAQKIVLNAFSTALMVRRGRTLGNLMAGMQVADAKLRARAVGVCVAAAGCDEAAATSALESTGWEVDAALLVLARGVSPSEARERLAATGGAIRAALE